MRRPGNGHLAHVGRPLSELLFGELFTNQVVIKIEHQPVAILASWLREQEQNKTKPKPAWLANKFPFAQKRGFASEEESGEDCCVKRSFNYTTTDTVKLLLLLASKWRDEI